MFHKPDGIGIAFISVTLANVIMCFMLTVKLRVTPADVLTKIRTECLELQLELNLLKAKQNEILKELTVRGNWMSTQEEKWKQLEAKTNGSKSTDYSR